tara:strand:- start:269 stop:1072 length:804 start_codon:yes stop_codon:yes gene_type:complete
MFEEEIYVKYFVKTLFTICIIQSIYTIYYKNTDFYINKIKYMRERFKDGDQHKFDCDIYRNEFNVNEIKNFISDDECDYIINIGEPKLRRSLTNSANPKNNMRTSKYSFFWKEDIQKDLILKELSKKIEKITGYPRSHQESFQILKYDIGNYYLPHYDACMPTDTFCLKKEAEDGLGTRVMTVYIYLNNVESGGETTFPNFNKVVKPLKGKCIFWRNIRYDAVDGCSLHCGEPPKSGIKWGLTCWIRDKPFKQPPLTTVEKIKYVLS